MASSPYAPPPNSRAPQPKVDGNDRRAIEAQNEDKHNTTMEALSDIKRVHNKEKKKKEQIERDRYQTRSSSQGSVSKIFISQINPPHWYIGYRF